MTIGPFSVSKELVAGLGDRVLRDLLGKLLEAEAAARGVPLSGIDLGGPQNAPDGGIDAAIVWSGGAEPGGWLPRRTIFFQCKAQVMASSAIGKEMRPKDGGLRPLFGEIAAAGGAYIIFSTDDVGTRGRDERLARMRAEIADLAEAAEIHLDFYGADRIARWVNEHLGVALWLLAESGRPLDGWRPFGSWSAPASAASPFLLDDSARATIGGGGTYDIDEAIEAMRGALRSGGGCVRLVGISGMGKTRLAEALFDPAVGGGEALPPALAIYADVGLQLGVGPALVTEQLMLARTDAVIVVDNCPARLHAQLAEIVRREGSRASLISIDYDVGDDPHVGTLAVRLEPNSDAIITALLGARAPGLTVDEINRLVRLSEGNARVALAFARGAGEGIDLSKLNDRELIDRLFQVDRAADPETRRVADAAALVYAFFADPSDVPVEHPLLAAIAGVRPQDFYRHVSKLLDWGLAQQRGPQRAIKPDAIANELAAAYLGHVDVVSLLHDLESGPPRLRVSFARRLGEIDGNAAAQAIARRLLAKGGWFGDVAAQDDAERGAFVRLAPAAPDVALAAIEDAVARRPAELFANREAREAIADLLAHLAYEDGRFGRAVAALVELALAEAPDGTSQNVRDALLQRFWPALAWTEARTDRRLAAIDHILADPRAAARSLGVEALGHMLDASDFVSSFDPQFGSRVRRGEWRPQGKDYDAWLDAAFERIETIVAGGGEAAHRARDIVAAHLRELSYGTHAARVIAAMMQVRPPGYWDAGWRAASEAVAFGGKRRNHLALEALEQSLRPRGIDQLFEAFVIGEPWRHYHPSGRERASVRGIATIAKATGVRLMRSGADLDAYLDRALAVDGHSSVSAFGEGLAFAADDPDALWRRAYARFAAANPETRNVGVILGILAGGDKRDAAWGDAQLDAAVLDPALNHFIVTLHAHRTLGVKDMKRLEAALDAGVAPDRLKQLMFGGVTAPIPAPALAQLLGRMIAIPSGAVPAVDVLSMRFHGDRSEPRPIAPELIAVARRLLLDKRIYEDRGRQSDHDIASLARTIFESGDGEAIATGICRTLRSLDRDRWSNRDFADLIAQLLNRHPRVVLDEIIAPDEQLKRSGLASRIFDSVSNDVDGGTGRKIVLDAEILLDWAAIDIQKRARQLARIVPYTVGGGEVPLSWSPIAMALIERAPDPLPILREFEQRFFSGVSTGSFSGRFVRRLPMVIGLQSHDDARIRSWAIEAEQSLHASIESWDEIDRRDRGLFE